MPEPEDVEYWKSISSDQGTKITPVNAKTKSMHSLFGCNSACIVKCRHCQVDYKNCNIGDVEKHELEYIHGICYNNNCTKRFFKCEIWSKTGTYVQHMKTHVKCTYCGESPVQCWQCRGTMHHCSDHCPRALEHPCRRLIDNIECRLCWKVLSTRPGLVAHYQHCMQHQHANVFTCPCGVKIVDEAHLENHTTPKKSGEKGKAKICTLRSNIARSKKYDETKVYKVGENEPVVKNPVITRICPIAMAVINELQMLNSPLLTISEQEHSRYNALTEELQKELQTIKFNGKPLVAQVEKSGSLVKNTAIPFMVDMDLKVTINNFDGEKRKSYAKLVKDTLTLRKGYEFVSGAPDILQCKYKGVDYDLVLVGTPERNDSRATDMSDGPSAAKALRKDVGCDNHVFEAIRGCKYWAKRLQVIHGCSLKSFLIENIVLYLHEKHSNAGKVELFELFLTFLKNEEFWIPQEEAGFSDVLEDLFQQDLGEEEENKENTLCKFSELVLFD